MTDAIASLAYQIAREGRRLDAIRYLRRNQCGFQTASKYVDEMIADAPWWERAHRRHIKATKSR